MSPPLRFTLVVLLVVLVTPGVLASAASAAVVTFAPAASFGTGVGPVSLAIGDLNGDGYLDLATANSAGTVSVLLGDGTGSFGPATDYGAGLDPTTIVVADVNGDGHRDIAVTNRNIGGPGPGSVSVLLGTGTGMFGPAASFGDPSGAWGIARGDLNGDGHTDLATSSGTVSVLFGDGTGGFSPATTVSPFVGALMIAAGDLNGDGRPDLATANFFNPTVSVLLNNGTGGFAAPVDFTVGTFPSSIAIGDLNSDRHADIVAGNGGSNSVSVLLGNGAGSFAPATNFATGQGPSSVAIGDLNVDGYPDLAVSNNGVFGGPGSISVLLGDGAGGFAPSLSFAVGSVPTSVGIGDLNRDGRGDVVTADYFPRTVSVLLNTTNVTLADLLQFVGNEKLGPGKSLLAKLESALNALQAGKTAAACGILGAFINEVNAQTGKSLTPEQATELSAAAARIRTALGC